jgi:hypothetical protein
MRITVRVVVTVDKPVTVIVGPVGTGDLRIFGDYTRTGGIALAVRVIAVEQTVLVIVPAVIAFCLHLWLSSAPAGCGETVRGIANHAQAGNDKKYGQKFKCFFHL